MSKRTFLSAAIVLAAGLAAATSPPAAAGLHTQPLMAQAAPEGDLLDLADARGYHHCHNMPRRTRCHSSERLPVDWPPNSNTPSTSSLRERHADHAGACAQDRRSRFWR